MLKISPRLLLIRLWLPVVIIAFWWFASAGSESMYFPPLSRILEIFVNDWFGPHFVSDLLPSLGKLVVGFFIAAFLGIAVGMVLGMSRFTRVAAEPIVLFFRSLPGPVLVPIGIMIIGIGAGMNIFIMVLGAVWPTLMNTIDGVRSLDPVQNDMTRSYRLTLYQKIRYVVLPNAGPQIFAGLRTTLQLAIILIVVSEMVASVNGVGFYVLYSQQLFLPAETWGGTILLGLIGYAASLIFVRVERRFLAWQAGTTHE